MHTRGRCSRGRHAHTKQVLTRTPCPHEAGAAPGRVALAHGAQPAVHQAAGERGVSGRVEERPHEGRALPNVGRRSGGRLPRHRMALPLTLGVAHAPAGGGCARRRVPYTGSSSGCTRSIIATGRPRDSRLLATHVVQCELRWPIISAELSASTICARGRASACACVRAVRAC